MTCTASSTRASACSASSPSATRSRSDSASTPTATRSWTRTSASTGKSREVYELIAIGTSWGGLDAISRLLQGLHDDIHQPIVVAQHRAASSDRGALEGLL